MNDMRYLIISSDNYLIHTMTHRPISATALIEGDGNLLVRGITSSSFLDYNKITDYNMFFKKVYTIGSQGLRLVEVDSKKVSPDWKATQQILKMRQGLFFNWETHTTNALTRVNRNKWEHFDVVAEQEIAKCRPADNDYTWIIEEYARTIEEPVEKAYKELKLRIESDHVTKFRIQALAEKWKRRINLVTTQTEANEVKQDMIREFNLNSLI